MANIDQLVVIASGAIPRTDPFLIDRVTAIAALKRCDVILLLNKCDLNRADELYDIYQLFTLYYEHPSEKNINELRDETQSFFSDYVSIGERDIIGVYSTEDEVIHLYSITNDKMCEE